MRSDPSFRPRLKSHVVIPSSRRAGCPIIHSKPGGAVYERILFMNRIQIEERKRIDSDTRMLALAKSDNRCCHCGCRFNYKHKFTIEHVIPISKGGDNTLQNLVALCDDCNRNKDNDIIDPVEYYRYLLPEHLKDLKDRQNEYNENINWFSPRNFFKEDKVVISLPYWISDRKKSRRRPDLVMKYVLEKAGYCDLDEISSVLEKYNKNLGIPQTRQDIYEEVSDHFERGVFYVVRNKSGEIVFVIPLTVMPYRDDSGAEGILPYMNGFVTRYTNSTYMYLAEEILHTLFMSIITVPVRCSSEHGFFLLNIHKNDAFLLRTVNDVLHYPVIIEEGDGDDEGFINVTIDFKLDSAMVKANTKQRNVSDEAQYALALRKYLEKNNYLDQFYEVKEGRLIDRNSPITA